MKDLVFEKNALYIRKLNLVAIADLHIGYEQALEKTGYHLPKSQYSKIKERLLKLIEKYEPEVLLINGDVKHEFGYSPSQEWDETLDLLDSLKKKVKILVIRGNHDNYLIPILKKRGIRFSSHALIKGYFFEHGHQEYRIPKTARTIVIAHEHPAISISHEFGRYKFKCFLKGKYKNKNLIVLPSFSPIMPGTECNVVDKNEFLSPILREASLEDFEVIIPEDKLYRFKMEDLI